MQVGTLFKNLKKVLYVAGRVAVDPESYLSQNKENTDKSTKVKKNPSVKVHSSDTVL